MKSDIYNLAIKKHEYWAKRKGVLKKLIDQVIDEISEIEKIDNNKTEIELKKRASKIKAVWVLSGTGTFKLPLTDVPGDQIYKGKSWGYHSDRDRIELAIKLIDSIGQCKPYLIYNGIEEQRIAINQAIESGELSFPRSKLYIPKGEVVKTLDQVKKLNFPEKYKIGDILVIVTHSAHYPRVLRMLNRYKTIPAKLSVVLYPAHFKNKKGSKEFTFNEIMGVLGYIALGEATIKSYKYLKWL